MLNFKYSVSPIRYGGLLHIWNSTFLFLSNFSHQLFRILKAINCPAPFFLCMA
ncbi:hypothetical protein BAE44_0013546 [Dichanthelium oligosanthes]|uniref:Uncharacterized protein n=1 Tax=Dichanthelium oligosanthes TaxID=888268 RepID=A0A1E5VK35_9POAL|nr:hypothetical protein BAE44_0013546 [Dichanthelium oligosanthes]